MEQPLNVNAEAEGHAPRPRNLKNLYIGGGVLTAVVVVVVVIVVATSSGSPKCSIDFCDKVSVPNGAKDCSQATCAACSSGRTQQKDAQGAFCALNCTSSLPGCAQGNAPRSASSCAGAPCQVCSDGYAFQLDKQTMMPTTTCGFNCTAKQLQSGCAPGSCTSSTSCSQCVPGFTVSTANLRAGDSACIKAAGPAEMTFYMYRAQSNTYYPPENVDLASASGVMWYLHNEVVNAGCQPTPTGPQRHYGITLILRFKVTMKNPPQVYAVHQGQMGHFATFDSGRCTNQDCESTWANYGYAVGCQPMDHDNYPHGAWYSLPGRCPNVTYSDPHKADCYGKDEPGGQCAQPDGTTTCTWHAERIDNISVDEFCGIQNYQDFCKEGNQEYNSYTDKGVGCDFWDDKKNYEKNSQRVLRLEQLFAAKSPGQTSLTTPDPLCDGF